LVPKPKGKKSLGVKWIYKEKENAKGEVERQAKDYSQKYEINYNEVFALASRLETIQLIIVITTKHR
jgi:hypothetical protein